MTKCPPILALIRIMRGKREKRGEEEKPPILWQKPYILRAFEW
jgi:hypothetical protein